MIKILLYIIGSVLIISTIAGIVGLNKKQEAKTKKHEEVVALGDSLTYGVGDNTGNGYVSDLQLLLSQNKGGAVTVHNYGIPGQQSDGLLYQIKNTDVKDDLDDADYFIIFIGTNDVLKSNGHNLLPIYEKRLEVGKADYENNIREILSIIRNKNQEAPILFLGLYNPFPDSVQIEQVIEEWNKTSNEIINEYPRVKFISTNELFQKKSTEYFSDSLHPNKKGYKLITKKIVNEYDF
ncbi:GDSL-type esterase/lipase family protein [Pseudalkalibacillus sp. A8]|uniref:DUF459 domain-containing protein n=1 Tax=Pseudalkalibacillus sp. A8 TaxID=3382641 RepID=UPI0038B6699D